MYKRQVQTAAQSQQASRSTVRSHPIRPDNIRARTGPGLSLIHILNDLTIYFNAVQMNSAARSGNGRLARNTVEKAILNQSRRILSDPQVRMDLLLREDFDLELSA